MTEASAQDGETIDVCTTHGIALDDAGNCELCVRATKNAAAASSGGALTEYREPGQLANPFDADPEAFAKQIQQRGENYQALVGWLVMNLVEGEDVVQVHVVKARECTYGGPRGDCAPSVCPGHWSDPDLSKKGAEKVCGLLGLGTRFLGMEDFRKAALKGIKIEHIVIDCELYAANGAVLSQGTGACSLDEVNGNLNSAMKKACKRAHVDAVKRCAGLSGLATEIKSRMPPVDPEAAARAAENAATQARHDGGQQRYASGAKLETIPFGKHKGKRWRDVDSGWLEWAVDKLTDKPDVVAAAAAELERRREASVRGAPPDGEPAPPPEFDDDIPY